MRSSLAVILLLMRPLVAIAQPHGHLKAGASYLHCSDPVGAGHGAHTGHRAAGMGIHLGVAFETRLNNRFGLRAESLLEARQVGYDMVQGRVPSDWPSGGEKISTGDRSTRLLHVQLPVILTLHEWSLLRLDAGFSTGYLLQANDRIRAVETYSGNTHTDIIAERNSMNSMARWECAVLLGAEVDSGRKLGMALRYLHGLTDLDRAPGTSPSFPRTWHVSLTYRLRHAG
ncbi:MAG: PorT family protein [Flavobacteriales bacterium]|nr:PorT family protein [Flavobacteriales bacterium]